MVHSHWDCRRMIFDALSMFPIEYGVNQVIGGSTVSMMRCLKVSASPGSGTAVTSPEVNTSRFKPFFAVFNTTISHESSIHKWIPNEDLRHKPEDVKLPPYHPDTPEMRHDWAQYYDKVEDMDA